jgi:hypothetical protein
LEKCHAIVGKAARASDASEKDENIVEERIQKVAEEKV